MPTIAMRYDFQSELMLTSSCKDFFHLAVQWTATAASSMVDICSFNCAARTLACATDDLATGIAMQGLGSRNRTLDATAAALNTRTKLPTLPKHRLWPRATWRFYPLTRFCGNIRRQRYVTRLPPPPLRAILPKSHFMEGTHCPKRVCMRAGDQFRAVPRC